MKRVIIDNHSLTLECLINRRAGGRGVLIIGWVRNFSDTEYLISGNVLINGGIQKIEK